ncbi:MAG: type IV toxin-antitoxin system AbiEi family antitoxin domain-containing protein [Candidatus Binatia bacterium]
MARDHLVHTRPGIELVRRLAAEGDRIFSTQRARELAPSVGLSEGYFRQALHHLASSGWLIRLRKGLYALSSCVPGVAPTHEFEVAMALVHPAAISHWSALHHHGLTQQTPREVFVLTTTAASVPRVRGAKAKLVRHGYRVGDTTYRFVQVRPKRYFGIEKVWVGEARVAIAGPERTLLDGLAMPQYCGDFAEVLHAFEVRGPSLDVDRIIHYALKLDAAAAKRLGWVLEHQGVEPSRLERLAAVPIKGYRKLDPTGPRKGPCHLQWMIQENLPGRIPI